MIYAVPTPQIKPPTAMQRAAAWLTGGTILAIAATRLLEALPALTHALHQITGGGALG